MYLINVGYMYRLLYLMCLKTKSTLSKKTKKNKKQKEKHFFLPFAAKRPGVNAASALDDHLRGHVYYLNWPGL